ncbi:hypothetical protein [Brassicibacter mesophilus]
MNSIEKAKFIADSIASVVKKQELDIHFEDKNEDYDVDEFNDFNEGEYI